MVALNFTFLFEIWNFFITVLWYGSESSVINIIIVFYFKFEGLCNILFHEGFFQRINDNVFILK